MDITPINNNILVKIEAKDGKDNITAGGILLPVDSELVATGKILKLGSGNETKCGKIKPFSVSVGQEVCFQTYGGSVINKSSDGSEYRIIKEQDILGIVGGTHSCGTDSSGTNKFGKK